MTGNDVIAAAPWIYFGTTVAAVCIRLLGLRRISSRRADRPSPASARDDRSGGGGGEGMSAQHTRQVLSGHERSSDPAGNPASAAGWPGRRPSLSPLSECWRSSG